MVPNGRNRGSSCKFRVDSDGFAIAGWTVMDTRLRIAEPRHRFALRAFLARLSPSTIRARYLRSQSELVGPALDQEMDRLLKRDVQRHVVVLALSGDDISAVGEFVVDRDDRTAELALVVEDTLQHRRIGQRIYQCLEQLARRQGISAFTCDVDWGNLRVQRLLRSSGRQLESKLAYGGIRYTLQLDRLPKEADTEQACGGCWEFAS